MAIEVNRRYVLRFRVIIDVIRDVFGNLRVLAEQLSRFYLRGGLHVEA